MKTLLDALLEKKLLHDENAVYRGQELLDESNCFRRVENDPFSGKTMSQHIEPDQFYTGINISPLRTLVSRVNFEWWWKRWGHEPYVLILSEDYNCLVRMGVLKWQAPWDRDPDLFAGGNERRIFVNITVKLPDEKADAFAEDYARWIESVFKGRPLDQGLYEREREGKIVALWDVDRDDPMDFLADLRDAVIERMGLNPENADARNFVEQVLWDGAPSFTKPFERPWPINLRRIYEAAGGDYRIEPDHAFALQEPSMETDPVASFDYDEDVVKAVVEDPEVRAVWSTGMAMNRTLQ